MLRYLAISLISTVILFAAPASYAHSFSTSFLNVSPEGLVKYQISFHDLVALNEDWLKDKSINRELLNQHLDDIEAFLQRTVILNAQDCQLNLIDENAWSPVTFANQKYMVVSAKTACPADAIDHIEVASVWSEFPDHKVIAEIKLPKFEKTKWVLSSDTPTIH